MFSAKVTQNSKNKARIDEKTQSDKLRKAKFVVQQGGYEKTWPSVLRFIIRVIGKNSSTVNETQKKIK